MRLIQDVCFGEARSMKVGIIKERRPGELRVAITPETVKKYIAMGLSVFIESKAGLTAAITDQSYKDSGANIVKTSRACSSDRS